MILLKKRVWVNGSFDVLHVGHIKLLNYAKSLGNLMIGIDSDNRIKKIKGQNRPFNCLEDRIYMLKSLKGINKVVTFDSENEMVETIKSWNPYYMVVGSDYKNKKVFGSEHTKKLVFFDRIEKYSTTKILTYYNK